MRIIVPPGVFRPRSDSWRLARAVAEAVRPGDSALDLCTGSGLVAVAAGRAGARPVFAVDVSALAVWAARLNGAIHGVRIRGRTGNLLQTVGGRRFDIISANPPYLPGTSRCAVPKGLSRAINGGADGRAVIDEIIAAAPAHLNPGGRLLLIHSSVCGIERTTDAMRAAGLVPQILDRTTGPLGPLLTERVDQLERAGLLQHTSRAEEIAVIAGTLAEPGTPR